MKWNRIGKVPRPTAAARELMLYGGDHAPMFIPTHLRRLLRAAALLILNTPPAQRVTEYPIRSLEVHCMVPKFYIPKDTPWPEYDDVKKELCHQLAEAMEAQNMVKFSKEERGYGLIVTARVDAAALNETPSLYIEGKRTSWDSYWIAAGEEWGKWGT